jgi:hypothetical protein
MSAIDINTTSLFRVELRIGARCRSRPLMLPPARTETLASRIEKMKHATCRHPRVEVVHATRVVLPCRAYLSQSHARYRSYPDLTRLAPLPNECQRDARARLSPRSVRLMSRIVHDCRMIQSRSRDTALGMSAKVRKLDYHRAQIVGWWIWASAGYGCAQNADNAGRRCNLRCRDKADTGGCRRR